MTANKMPEMPEPSGKATFSFGPGKYKTGGAWSREQVEADRRACYLAGLEAAKACVPAEEHGPSQWAKGSNDARELTLTNLTALEQEAKK